MKRRKWFDRIINNRVQKSENKEKHDESSRNTTSDHFHNIENKLHEHLEKKHIFTKPYLNNITENNRNCDLAKHQMLGDRMHLKNKKKHKRKIKKDASHVKTRNHKKDLETKQSLSKNNEIKKIEKALDSLKNEIHSKVDIQNKPSETKGYVCNLGKVINNILTEIIEKHESNGKEFDEAAVHSYFQSVTSCSKLINDKNKITDKNTDKSFNNRSPIVTQIMHNDTDKNVINRYKKINRLSRSDKDKNVDIKIASISNKKNTLKINKDIKSAELLTEPLQKDAYVQVQFDSFYISDADKNKIMDSKLKCFKMVNSEFTSKENMHTYCNKSKFTVRHNMNRQLESKKCYRKTKTKLNKCKSVSNTNNEYLWMWDGKKFRICIDLKKRIETLILKELQKLALKESFEYSISQINDHLRDSSTSITFLCQLDVSDKKIKCLSRTINKKCTDYKSTNIDVKLDPTDRTNIYDKSQYKESIQNYSTTLNAAPCKDYCDESTVTKEHTLLVPNVQHKHMSTSKVNMENKTGYAQLPRTTNTKDDAGTCFYFNNNRTPLSKIHANKTYKYPPTHINSTRPSKLDDTMGTKQFTHIYPAEQPQNVEINYFNMNWTSEGTSNHIMDTCKKERIAHVAKNENSAETNFPKLNQIGEVKENKTTEKKITKVKTKPKSDESLWNGIKMFFEKNIKYDKTLQKQIQHKTINTCSEGTRNTQSTVEIELDLKNFRSILEKTKEKNKYKTDQCAENKSQKHKHSIHFANTDQYTKKLLTETAKKLEEYIKRKEQQKGKKRSTAI